VNSLSKEQVLQLINEKEISRPEERVRYRGLTICVVMASWNEEGKVGKGVASVPKDIVDTVLVVDNGSEDNTKAEAEESGALVLSHPMNLGAGGGYRSGWIFGKEKEFDLIVELAGDNQDDPSEIPQVADVLIDDELDYVQGSRWMKGGKRENMTFSRTALTWIYSKLFRILFRTRITDATNGFRAFRSKVLDNPKLNLWQDWLLQYEMEPYLLIQTCRSEFKVGEAPVTKRYHNDMKENTKMVPVKSWWSILRPLFLLSLRIYK